MQSQNPAPLSFGKPAGNVLQYLEIEELDRRYVEGYRKKPEELEWAQASVRLLSRRLAREKW